MIERRGILQFKNHDVSIVGMDLTTDMDAPEFTAVDQDWNEISVLKATQGKLRIIASLPSLETTECDREVRRFNQEVSSLCKDIVVIAISAISAISADLPFTQARWCGSAGIEGMMVISDHKYTDFGKKYACLLSEPRILRRAVFIVDCEDMLRYAVYMSELGIEPDYGEVVRTAKGLIK